MNLLFILFWILALVNSAPAIAAISARQITKLYGVPLTDKTQIVLLQHRALLLGLVGALCAAAAHMESLRWFALIGAVVSMLSFIVICVQHGELGGRLRKIVIVDAAALPIAAIIAYLMYKN